MSGGEWRVKYDGTCSQCGRVLRQGEVAVYERASRTIHCVECPSDPPIDAGTAGGSARQEYERRSAKREERIRGKLGRRLGGVVLALTDEPQTTRAWAIGSRGEEKLAKAVADVPGLVALHDRQVPGTRGNIDHVLIAPAGVFVVDAKHYEGRIEIRDRGRLFRPDLRLYVGRRDHSELADGLARQVEAVIDALAAAGVEPPPPLTPVLCFIDGDWPLISPPHEFRGVRITGERSLKRLLGGPAVLDAAGVPRLAETIARALPAK